MTFSLLQSQKALGDLTACGSVGEAGQQAEHSHYSSAGPAVTVTMALMAQPYALSQAELRSEHVSGTLPSSSVTPSNWRSTSSRHYPCIFGSVLSTILVILMTRSCMQTPLLFPPPLLLHNEKSPPSVAPLMRRTVTVRREGQGESLSCVLLPMPHAVAALDAF